MPEAASGLIQALLFLTKVHPLPTRRARATVRGATNLLSLFLMFFPFFLLFFVVVFTGTPPRPNRSGVKMRGVWKFDRENVIHQIANGDVSRMMENSRNPPSRARIPGAR